MKLFIFFVWKVIPIFCDSILFSLIFESFGMNNSRIIRQEKYENDCTNSG